MNWLRIIIARIIAGEELDDPRKDTGYWSRDPETGRPRHYPFDPAFDGQDD